MKQKQNYSQNLKKTLLAAVICVTLMEAGAQTCSNPANVIYGFTPTGQIRPITVSTGVTGAALNPAYTGNAPSYANATGYNPLNGKFYFFKRNPYSPPQEFMSFDPATNTYQMLASAPIASTYIVNLGCVTANGLGFYCLDAIGTLYYYRISTNTWTTICTNIRNQYGTTMFTIIDPMGSSPRYYGDISIDGYGNMWMLISGASNYGLYKINAPLPTSTVANLTATQILPPTTAAPMGSFGGIAFNSTGQMLMSTNSPNNRLYRMNDDYTLSFISNLSVDAVGNDLTSCNFPMFVLSSQGYTFSATLKNNNSALISWTMTQSLNTNGYTIEYSADGNQWHTLSYIQKTGIDLSKTYLYTHSNLVNGTHYYRIRVTDYSSSTTYSTIKKVDVSQSGSISVWPNPASHELKVQQPVFEEGSNLYLHDFSGKLIKMISLKGGINKIDIRQLPAGTYLARIRSSNGFITNQQFIKQ